MGKGDKKTRRGKLFNGSYGVTRPRKKEEGKKK
ncbi:MAG: 30S ribosomal protein THX [Bacteroidales bacterium]